MSRSESNKNHLLSLPRELRDEILGHAIFSPLSLHEFTNSDDGSHGGLLYNDKNDPVFAPNEAKNSRRGIWGRLQISVLRTCRQLFSEGERVLYHSLIFKMATMTPGRTEDRANMFLERLTPRQRGLIRRLWVDAPLDYRWMTWCEWKNFTHLVSRDCSSLQILRVSCPSTPVPSERWTQHGWMNALLRIRPKKGIEWSSPSRCNTLRIAELNATRAQANLPSTITSFSVMNLPPGIRRNVWRHLLIPANGVVHPCLGPRVDETTLNVLPLFLSCKTIHEEAESVLYGKAIFSSCLPRYERKMRLFFYSRTPRQLKLMRRFFCHTLDHWADPSFDEFLLSNDAKIQDMQRCIDDYNFSHPCFQAR